jgi:CRP/FNR family transcriptional regulator
MVHNKAQALGQSLVFSCLDGDELAELAGLAVERVLKSGETVFWEGDAPDWFYMVVKGRVKVLKHSSLGKEFIIAFFGPGEMFGEVAVLQGRPYPASAQAMGETEVLGIRREELLSFLGSRPEASLRMVGVLGGRLRDAHDRLRDIAGERVDRRIARMLLMLSSKLGDTLPFTRQEIADMAGTTSETATRVIGRLREGDIIRSDRGEIVVLDEIKLRLLGEGPPRV